MLATWTKYIKLLLSRSIVFYLLCFLIVWKILDYNQLSHNAIAQTLSRLTPPIDYFAEFVDKKDHYDRFKLMNGVNYHQAVARYYNFQKAEALGMLGFCYDRLGKRAQAVASYKQAIDANPDYFWPYYDLGVIYYKEGQYSHAEDYFQQAIRQDPFKTIFLLSRSKVYNDVMISKRHGKYDPLAGLKEGRMQAYILWMDSLYKSGAWPQMGQEAIDGLRQGMDIDGIFYYYAGVFFFKQKSYEKSLPLLQIALQKDPKNTDALYYLGLCLQAAGKVGMGQEFIDKAAIMKAQGGDVIFEQLLKPQVRFF